MKINILWASLKQMGGMIKLEYKYNGNYPSIENYSSNIKYSLPFNESWIVINGGVTELTSHSWDIPTQRYAYDFIIMDEKENAFNGDEINPFSFYCYGKDIISPADGIVLEAVDGNIDSQITKGRIVSCQSRDIRGNYIVIKHGEEEYSTLAHLKINSIMVEIGQNVKKGEKIAECGNSGNSTEPHLHFQIQNGVSFYSSMGLPIEFENINRIDAYKNSEFNIDEEKLGLPYISKGDIVNNK